jgi:hypothetical protein
VQRVATLPVTAGQLQYEWGHLMSKLAVRNPALRKKWCRLRAPQCHPLFKLQPGGVEGWERAK